MDSEKSNQYITGLYTLTYWLLKYILLIYCQNALSPLNTRNVVPVQKKKNQPKTQSKLKASLLIGLKTFQTLAFSTNFFPSTKNCLSPSLATVSRKTDSRSTLGFTALLLTAASYLPQKYWSRKFWVRLLCTVEKVGFYSDPWDLSLFALFQAAVAWAPTTKESRNTKSTHAKKRPKPCGQQTAYPRGQSKLANNKWDRIAESLLYRRNFQHGFNKSQICPKAPWYKVLWLANARLFVDDSKCYRAALYIWKKKNKISSDVFLSHLLSPISSEAPGWA